MHLKCQVRCFAIQGAVVINPEVRQQPLIKGIFEGDWAREMAANQFFVRNTVKFSMVW